MSRLSIVACICGSLIACTAPRPIYLSPSPSPSYHKENALTAIHLIPLTEPDSATTWISGEFLTWANKELHTDWGVIPHFVLSSDISSANFFFYYRKWLGLSKHENPWGNVYGGIQLSYNHYENKKYYNDKKYNNTDDFPVHFELGFAPGIYRKRFNIAFPIRVGMGFVLNQSSSRYFYMGPCIQTSFRVTPKLYFQGQFNFNWGFGASEENLYIGIPSIFTLGLYFQF